MMKFWFGAVVSVICVVAACDYKADIPTEFPTPPIPVATPLAKLEIKRDAELEKQIETIIAEAKGKVGVAAVVIETGEAALVNAGDRYPMQSVYKLPIAMAVMDQVRLGKLALGERVVVTKDDMVRQGMRSPLRDQFPNGAEFNIGELISMAIVESDGTASDVLIRVAGGAPEVQSFLTQIGVRDLKIVNIEKEIGRDWQTQYDNWATPEASVELLRWLDASAGGWRPPNLDSELTPNQELLQAMFTSMPGPGRLKGLVPLKGPFAGVAHKTGTSGTQDGITAATNDIGIMYIPNGPRIAIAVYVSDSKASIAERERVIAKVAKAVWDRWSGAGQNTAVHSANFNDRHTLN